MPLEPWRDQHPLEGPYLKLKRARKHLETIDEYSSKFDAISPHELHYVLNSQGDFYECRLIAKFPPFLDFWLEIGEFCYQLRSALDHLIYACSRFPEHLNESERSRAERDTAFPIALERQRSDSGVRGRLKSVPTDISEDLFNVVDRFQPYQQGNREQALDHPLALLDELSNLDKHRSFKVLPVTVTIDLIGLDSRIQRITGSSAGHGALLALVPSDLDPVRDFGTHLRTETFLPTMRHGGWVKLENLGLIHQYVAGTVLPSFKQFFDPVPSSIEI